MYKRVLKSSQLWVKENRVGSVNYDCIQVIPLLELQPYYHYLSIFLSLKYLST